MIAPLNDHKTTKVETVSQGAILHLFGWDKKFVLPFRDLIHEHFVGGQHRFIVYGDVQHELLPPSADTVVYRSLLKNCFALSNTFHQVEKIMLHGIFSSHLLYILALQPWLLKKCHWAIWGGDLYSYQAELKNWRWKKNEFFRRFVIQRIGYLITYVPGDVELARRWYGAKGKYKECLVYPSNIFRRVDIPDVIHTTTTVLIGNSASPSNNHLEVFDRLSKLEDQSFKLICPLSYGDNAYAKQVVAEGARLFGDRFLPLLDFIPYQDYLKVLSKVDIAVFAHRRQQGMGNIITLLGLGKKVFMEKSITSWDFLKQIGIEVYDIEELHLSKLNVDTKKNNLMAVYKYFSKSNLIHRLGEIFA